MRFCGFSPPCCHFSTSAPPSHSLSIAVAEWSDHPCVSKLSSGRARMPEKQEGQEEPFPVVMSYWEARQWQGEEAGSEKAPEQGSASLREWHLPLATRDPLNGQGWLRRTLLGTWRWPHSQVAGAQRRWKCGLGARDSRWAVSPSVRLIGQFSLQVTRDKWRV